MPDTSVTTLVIQGIVAAGGTGTAAAVVGAIVSRRKTKAETDKTVAETGRTHAEIAGLDNKADAELVSTAMGMLREVRVDLDRVRAEAVQAREDAATARSETEILRSWRYRQEALNAQHGEWDVLVTHELAEHGVTLPPPPPLTTNGH